MDDISELRRIERVLSLLAKLLLLVIPVLLIFVWAPDLCQFTDCLAGREGGSAGVNGFLLSLQSSLLLPIVLVLILALWRVLCLRPVRLI